MRLASIMGTAAVRSLAPKGTLRVGINMSNFLLVSSRGPAGEPQGVAPDMGASLASALGLPVEYVQYANPGLLGDAARDGAWDVALLGAEPARAATMSFTLPYAEIEATYLVRDAKRLPTVQAVDAAGVSVAVSRRAAYELWLSANLERATLHRTAEPGLLLSRELFLSEGHDVLAGLRPWLVEQCETIPGSAVLDGRFASVQQAICTPRSREPGGGGEATYLEHLNGWIQEAKASGLVEGLIEKHGVSGKLSVAT